MKVVALALLLLVGVASATVLYEENFDDGDSWKSRWVQSSHKKSDGTAGDLVRDRGDWYGDAKTGYGVKTGRDARFYAWSAPISSPFSSVGRDMVLQFSVKHAQKIDCGGGYIKVFPSSLDPATFDGDAEYNIMFGPDICGSSTKKVHVILGKNGENHLINKDIRAEDDQLTHFYTLWIRPDNTYEVRVDGDVKASGSIEEDWGILPPKTIPDPDASKPADWVDEAVMDDPNDTKPSDWDDVPQFIPDPEAEKPDDWDDESDGEWDAPMLENPEWQGEWAPKKIPNPDYQGPWEHPHVPNPDYEADPTLYAFKDNAHVGFEIWQVKAGTIFDNILISDSIEDAEDAVAAFEAVRAEERSMFDDAESARREQEEAERKAREAEKAALEDDDDEDDDDWDEDDDEDDYDDHDEL